eukprot:3085113-Amphidinium_carterae.1
MMKASSADVAGPTYVKLGQSLASRPDVVTTEVADELLQLQVVPPAVPAQRLKINIRDRYIVWACFLIVQQSIKKE